MDNLYSKNIAIVGTGNVAGHICKAIKDAGLNLRLIIGRDRIKVHKLANKFSVNYTIDFKSLPDTIDIVFFCVKDDALEEVLASIQSDLKNKILLHTSGSLPINILKKRSKHVGVFYPLFSFTQNRKVNFRKIPILIESKEVKTNKIIIHIAHLISEKVMEVNSNQRLKIHLSAVFANNFVNYLYTVAEDYLKENKLPFQLLVPLITDAAQRLQKYSPSEMQTGPAKRGDKKVMNMHLELLNQSELKKIYNLLSEQIQKRFKS